MIKEIIDAIKHAEDVKENRVLIIRGLGQAFCAGLDLKEDKSYRNSGVHVERWQHVLEQLATFSLKNQGLLKPTPSQAPLLRTARDRSKLSSRFPHCVPARRRDCPLQGLQQSALDCG